MASPQLENGHTRISNELLEAILRTRFTAHELKCLLAVARETYGWSRKAKAVPTNRIATLTGLTWVRVAAALQRLKARNILANGADGLAIQKDYENWMPLGAPTPVQNGPYKTDRPKRTRSEMDHFTPYETDHSPPYETYGHKERKQENKKGASTSAPQVPSPVHTLLALYQDLFLAQYQDKPNINGGKDAALLKRLVGRYGEEKVADYLRRFFESRDHWIQQSGHTIGVFSSSFNKLIEQEHQGKPKGLYHVEA